MKKEAGVTLTEAMIVIAIIAILSAIAIPNWLSWRANAKINGAATNLRGDLEMAKNRAIKENLFIAAYFSTNAYDIFFDNGANPGSYDAGETVLRNRQLAAGVSINQGNSVNWVRFSARGSASNSSDTTGVSPGKIIVQDSRGVNREIEVNGVGRISLKY